MATETGWQFWIDRGGTFTDIVARSPAGELISRKLLSANPAHYRDAAAEGIRRVLQDCGGGSVAEIRMGTTVATNALLERKGARTGLLITRGFGDALLIGNQDRPRLFDLHIRKAAPLFTAVAEVDERLDAAGDVLQPLQTQSLQQELRNWREQNIDSVAICLVHAWLNPAHEQQLAAHVRAAGFAHVHVSHEVSPMPKLIGRAGTTVADAYLSPVLLSYVAAFRQELDNAGIACERIYFMQSNGGLVQAGHFRGKNAVLSGPAGGVVAMQAAGARAGLEQLIGFDMGGTSTDVSLCDGAPEIVSETAVAGVQLRAPMIRIHTVAAGGGSLLRFAQGRFQAGPESAGAEPGPLSYGRGGPLALTDANLALGRIQPDFFPRVFGTDSNRPLDKQAVQLAFAELARAVSAASGRDYDPEQTAQGFLRVAVDNMANAIRHISVSRGLDPARYTLCCFGGAGGQHACAVAEQLGIRKILLDSQAGVLSAWGMGVAPLRSYRERGINQPLNDNTLAELKTVAATLQAECQTDLLAQGAGTDTIAHQSLLQLKVAGTDTPLMIPLAGLQQMRTGFAENFRRRYGFAPDATELHIEALRCEAVTQVTPPANPPMMAGHSVPEPAAQVQVYLAQGWQSVPVYRRELLCAADSLSGPALIVEANSTTVLEHGWQLTANTSGQLLLEHIAEARQQRSEDIRMDPVQLEIINHRFVAVAEEMGTVLRKTARSVNIRERLDFSCALFTATGELIANAPHVPVHLGSMDDAVKTAIRDYGDELRRGDVILTNAPYSGGTHLPDVTAISALVSDTIQFVVASRAHHADIGGNTPGSMPPFSRHIDEEGVLIDHLAVVRQGEFRETALRELLGSGAWPARNPDQNVADFRAQLAANERGRQLLRDMLMEFGDAVVLAYAGHVQTNAEMSVRDAITRLHSGRFVYPLDSGQQICVTVSIDRNNRAALLDFTGTSAAAANNLNAPRAVCQAAVLYVFRTLVQTEIPLNGGCNKPLRLIIPPGCMLDPAYPAAVVGGNVETSQCIADALYGALGVLAGSQGTMNNLSFGDAQHQYYETIAGGAGAGASFPGADAVQSHMTNTRITDVEVIESRFPVLVREFSIRRGSGGAGAQAGGDGVIRKLEFRQAMSAAILSNNRANAPFGLCGGSPGRPGQNCIVRRNGAVETHSGTLATDMEAGDVLIIETPGGGGYGSP